MLIGNVSTLLCVCQIEESQLPTPALEEPSLLEVEHARDEAVSRIEEQAHGARAAGREPSVAGYSDSGSWKKVCSWTLSQPSRAYSRMSRPLETLPVPVSGGHAELTASRRLEHPEIAVAQIESAEGDGCSGSHSRLNTTSASAEPAALSISS